MLGDLVSDVGEFGLIRRIGDLLEREGKRSALVSIGIGDDTASFLPRSGYELLVTCDCMVEDRHFLPEFISPYDLGRRAMTMNISDIGAMGGNPLYSLISLGLKPDLRIHDIEEMYRGFLAELNPFDASIIGGNLTKSDGKMFIDITLIGEVKQGRAVRRAGARPGNAILLTGYPGQAAAGLKMLFHKDEEQKRLLSSIIQCYLNPSHRARAGAAVARVGCATAMIDISDGFLGDLNHICEQSGVGAELDKKKFPLSKVLQEAAHTMEVDAYDLFLGESDDYELIITCSPENVALIRTAIAGYYSCPVTEVGRIIENTGQILLLQSDGTRHPINISGWDHFR